MQQISCSESDAYAQGVIEVELSMISGYAAKAAAAAQERAAVELEKLETAQH